MPSPKAGPVPDSLLRSGSAKISEDRLVGKPVFVVLCGARDATKKVFVAATWGGAEVIARRHRDTSAERADWQEVRLERHHRFERILARWRGVSGAAAGCWCEIVEQRIQ